jgi:hypothetical protein
MLGVARAFNAGFVWSERRSTREHANVWVMNLENEIEDIRGPPLSLSLSLSLSHLKSTVENQENR